MEESVCGGYSSMVVHVVRSISDSCVLAILICIFYMVDRVGSYEALHPYEEIWL